jgi:acyl carrier protein
VPSAFVRMEALPLTPNGKVDRRNLPPPEGERQSTAAYVAPQKELEKTIAGIWQELLQVERVGVDDSFFDLGGHSLLLVQAHGRLSEVVDKELSVTDMFRFPTIHTLSQYLGQDLEEGNQSTGQDSLDRARVRREAMLRRRQRRQNLHKEISDEAL